jgi:hypothetical protein
MDEPKPFLFKFLGAIFAVGPLIFAFGFIAPLVAQSLSALDISMPGDLSPVTVGLAVAALWGGFAQWKGRWI